MWKKTALAVMVAGLLVGCESNKNTMTEEQIGKIASDYIVAHPEVLIKASQALQKQRIAEYTQKISSVAYQNLDALTKDKNSPTAGASTEDAKVTVVEFFDYQCPFCKKSASAVAELLKNHSDKVKVVFKESPIFGSRWKASDYAAEMALFIYKTTGSEGYLKYHNSLLESKIEESKLTNAEVNEYAKKAGLRILPTAEQLKEQSKETKKNLQLFGELGFEGTPAFVVIPADVKSAKDISVVMGADLQSLSEAINKVIGS